MSDKPLSSRTRQRLRRRLVEQQCGVNTKRQKTQCTENFQQLNDETDHNPTTGDTSLEMDSTMTSNPEPTEEVEDSALENSNELSEVESIASDHDEMEDEYEHNLAPSTSSPTVSITEQALFPGSQLSSEQFMIVLMQFCHRHNLSYACQNDLLKLLAQSHPSPNCIARSNYSLMKQFVDFNQECVVKRYCASCLEIKVGNESCSTTSCAGGYAVLISFSLAKLLQEQLKSTLYILSYLVKIVVY